MKGCLTLWGARMVQAAFPMLLLSACAPNAQERAAADCQQHSPPWKQADCLAQFRDLK